jgi:L-threonylcarbamoyladenylate synthase
MKNIHSNIEKAKKYLSTDNVVAIPTETVYGLAGNAYSDNAVIKIFSLKKRSLKNPLIVHYCRIKDLKKDCIVNGIFYKLYKKFCPGPLTFVLNKKKNSKLSKYVNANKKTIAVRFPKNKITQNLLSKLNFPLAAPSANISSKLSPVTVSDVKDEFGNKIKLILNGGKTKIGLESTIVDLTDKVSILRPGGITIEQLEKELHCKLKLKNHLKQIKSPGQSRFHYSPGIPLRINAKYPKKNEAFLQYTGKVPNKKNYFILSKKGNMREAAKNLFSILRLIKKKGYSSIAVSKIPNQGLGLAINDRLKRASKK